MEIGMALMRSRGDYNLQANNTIGQGINFEFLPRHDAAPSEWLLHHARWTLVTAATSHGRAATLRRNITVKDHPQKGNAFGSSIFGKASDEMMSFANSNAQAAIMDGIADAPKKRTRRRLRVSCVECTRRRQKCDRQQPCSLCKTRGVEHLCRWENEPFARPAPARPPRTTAPKREKLPNLITSWQISTASSPTLSQAGPTTAVPHPWRRPSPPFASASEHESSDRASSAPPALYHEGVKSAALTLAKMEFNEEDRHLAEGSLVYAIQELTDPATAGSSEPLLTRSLHSTIILRSSQPFVPRLPDKAHCEALLLSFHEHVNWSIGIPKDVLFAVHEAMWKDIRADPKALETYHPSWLSLLFAMFAFSPACATEEESRDYFNQALATRKLQEERYASLDSPPASADTRGAVYACLAAAFLARYLQDRGQIAEAWRVAGSGVRDAQNAELHRCLAPGRSKHLTTDERTFALVAWHLCVEFDRFLSLFLGRPAVVRSRDCNVQFPSRFSGILAHDGSTNTALMFQYYFISMTRIVGEAKERFLSVLPDPDDGHAYFDTKMAEWLASLPPFLRVTQPADTSYDILYPKLYLQRLTLKCYYTCSCLLYHRSLAYSQPADQPPAHNWDQSLLAHYAIKVLYTQRELLQNQWWERQVPFDISMYMFEASVTLGVTILREMNHRDANEWRRELEYTIGVFESLRAKDFGKIVGQAIQVLRILQNLCDASNANVPTITPPGYMNDTSLTAQAQYEMLFGTGLAIDQEEPKVFFPMNGYPSSAMTAPPPSTSTYNGMWAQAGEHNNGLATMSDNTYAAYPIWTTDEMMVPGIDTDSVPFTGFNPGYA